MRRHERRAMKIKNIAFVVLSLFGLSCEQSTSPTRPKIGEEFELKYGQSTQIQGQNLSIKFKNVAEDSRCPKGAFCVWEGNAKIVLQVAQQDTSVNTSLEPREITYSRYPTYTIRLVSVSPYPNMSEQIKLEDYTIKLIVFTDEIF